MNGVGSNLWSDISNKTWLSLSRFLIKNCHEKFLNNLSFGIDFKLGCNLVWRVVVTIYMCMSVFMNCARYLFILLILILFWTDLYLFILNFIALFFFNLNNYFLFWYFFHWYIFFLLLMVELATLFLTIFIIFTYFLLIFYLFFIYFF